LLATFFVFYVSEVIDELRKLFLL